MKSLIALVALLALAVYANQGSCVVQTYRVPNTKNDTIDLVRVERCPEKTTYTTTKVLLDCGPQCTRTVTTRLEQK